MSPFLLMQKKKLMTLVRVKKQKKTTLKYKLFADQVTDMLPVIRLTMKKNNITKLLQHYSSQWLVIALRSVLQDKNTLKPALNIKEGTIICKRN